MTHSVLTEPPPIPAPWRYREGARAHLVKRGQEDVAKAIVAGLDWLGRSQQQDGSLSATNGVRSTALALLAWLGDGSTIRGGDHVDSVKRGLIWLKDQQDQRTQRGFVGDSYGSLYDHAIATTAIVETYAMSQYRTLKRYAQQAVDALWLRQTILASPGGRPAQAALAPWSALALHTAALAGLNVNGAWREGLLTGLDAITDPATGRYVPEAAPRAGESKELPWPEASLTAGLLFARSTAAPDRDKQPLIQATADAFLRAPPGRRDDPAQPAPAVDPCAAWFAGQALREVGGPRWERWLHMLTQELLARQKTEGEPGSWDPMPGLDRAGTTALAVLCLQLHYVRTR